MNNAVCRRATKNDVGYIMSLLGDLDNWRYLADDNSPMPVRENIETMLNVPQVYFLIPEFLGKPAGLFFLMPQNSVTYDLHTIIQRDFRGQPAIAACQAMGVFMFGQTPCRKIVTSSPVSNVRAKYLARKCGMRLEGVNRMSYLRDGALHDQYVFGICKGEAPCQ
jgi:RimJ/RimL family protein N-acetyltransferase